MEPKELLKLTIDAMVEAGPDGWCKGEFWLDHDGISLGDGSIILPDPEKVHSACLIGRASIVSGLGTNDCANLLWGLIPPATGFSPAALNDMSEMTFDSLINQLNKILEA